MKVLFFGDIVSQPGRRAIRNCLPDLKMRYSPDVLIANAENAAAGFGLTQPIAKEFFDMGFDALTLGNHTYARSEIFRFIESEKRIARPANVSESWPGMDFVRIARGDSGTLIVLNLLGQVEMSPCDSPFAAADRLLESIRSQFGKVPVLLDFHAEATSEKVAMGYYLDGRVSAVLGTHTHVQTADECIRERGTAYITDVGMTGVVDSVLGMAPDVSLRRLKDRLPAQYTAAAGRAMVNAVYLDIDRTTGKCIAFERIRTFEPEST